jgi:hypothetical protein
MSLFGPVTNAERAGWQRRAARGLVQLLDAAAEYDLPVLIWQLSGSSRLVGRCNDLDVSTRRQAFERWCAFLGEVDRWPERDTNGVTHLHAIRHRWGVDGRVDVVVLADIHTDEDHDGTNADRA